jgi:multiple sugar transport system ATP-binding protein
MGRAIVRRPQAFLMDEPLSNLDARLRVEMRRQVARIQKALATTTLYVTHDQTEAMTLGDRIVVMRSGVVQQVGPPRRLYEAPTNLFVAGFIGSPSMNFVPATVEGDVLRSPLGETPLPERLRRAVDEGAGGREVILGLRPEDFEEAGKGRSGPDGARAIRATLELVEPMGSQTFAYFTIDGERPHAAELADLAAEAGAGSRDAGLQMVARLDPSSGASEGDRVELGYDPARIHLFDARSGKSLGGTAP